MRQWILDNFPADEEETEGKRGVFLQTHMEKVYGLNMWATSKFLGQLKKKK